MKLGAAVGLLAFGVWISPQVLFHASPRLDGFDPEFFGSSGWPYWTNLAFRLARMVIVVPLLEEIFWRGFLLRYLVHDDFRRVPFGTFTWTSFIITTAGFCLEHQAMDWPAAAVTGILYNLTACRTRSLLACVVAHAVTNLALALYVLQTRQWGFW
jgi:CAAX prenyl protease-like protein